MLTTVLFDMDGTLFDTEKIYREAWTKVGVPLDVYYSFVGTPLHNIYDALEKKLHLDPEKTYAERVRVGEEIIQRDGIQEKPGMEYALKTIRKKGFRTAICTSSGISVADRYLDATGTGDLFDLVFSGMDLKNGKPAPDIWLMAAKKMQAAPDQCVVVEDSWNGVRSGHAAKMVTVMIPDLQAPTEEMQHLADKILPSLNELPAYLETLQSSEKN